MGKNEERWAWGVKTEGVGARGRCGRKTVMEAVWTEGELGGCGRKAVMEAVWTEGGVGDEWSIKWSFSVRKNILLGYGGKFTLVGVGRLVAGSVRECGMCEGVRERGSAGVRYAGVRYAGVRYAGYAGCDVGARQEK